MRIYGLVLCLLLGGCSSRTFTDLGNGTGVPTESLAKYAEEHGLSRDEARKAMMAEMEARERAKTQ